MYKQGLIFEIGDHKITANASPFCIAEVGINHNGSLERAKEMVNVAKQAGADAVKFQTFDSDQLCGDPEQMFTYQSQGQEITEPMLDMFRRNELGREEWYEIKAHCAKVGITFFSTPQNVSDLELLSQVGVDTVKVGSDDLSNLPLLREYASFGLPMILSCGMADMADVHAALIATGWYTGAPVSMLLCTSQYPTPPQDVNIRKLDTLTSAFPGLIVGFSDHTQGALAAAMAVAKGAVIFEKHFTLSHDLAGPDHWFSCNPEELTAWVQTIRQAHQQLGSPHIMPTHEERNMRILARRSVVAIKDIEKGEIFTTDNVAVRRPGIGLSPELFDNIVGQYATRRITLGTPLDFKDVGGHGTE